MIEVNYSVAQLLGSITTEELNKVKVSEAKLTAKVTSLSERVN